MPAKPQVERTVREHCDAQRWREATVAALEGYGPEILGYLVARTRDRDQADEVFAVFCEDVWKGLPKFAWAASFRTWAYRVAHNARARWLARTRRREHVPLSDAPQVFEAAQRVRTSTALHLRTEVKDAISQLRDALPEADRSLLILRVDRGLSWGEIAEIHDEDRSKAATYRKRFERAKARLAELAREAGLL